MYAHHLCPLENLRIRNPVLPFDVEQFPEASQVECVQLPNVAAIHCPRLTGVQQGRQHDWTVHIELGLQADASPVPYTGGKSAENCTRSGHSVGDLLVDIEGL